MFKKVENDYYGRVWEELCWNSISTNGADGVLYGLARHWWDSYYNKEKEIFIPVELDIVAESFDGKHLFLGECKWQELMKMIYLAVHYIIFAELSFSAVLDA